MVKRESKDKGGRPTAFNDQELERLRALIMADPTLTLRALADQMALQTGRQHAPMTISRGLGRLGLSKVAAKKLIVAATPPPEAKETRYRPVHRREPMVGRYPSSLTDYEWEALEPIVERDGGRGRPSDHDRREMWDAVFYLVRSGSSWRMLPSNYPSYKAVFAFFARARDSGLLDRVYERLHRLWRERAHRDPLASAGAVDSQSVKTTEKGGSADSTRARRSRGGKGS
jgi:transposase